MSSRAKRLMEYLDPLLPTEGNNTNEQDDREDKHRMGKHIDTKNINPSLADKIAKGDPEAKRKVDFYYSKARHAETEWEEQFWLNRLFTSSDKDAKRIATKITRKEVKNLQNVEWIEDFAHDEETTRGAQKAGGAGGGIKYYNPEKQNIRDELFRVIYDSFSKKFGQNSQKWLTYLVASGSVSQGQLRYELPFIHEVEKVIDQAEQDGVRPESIYKVSTNYMGFTEHQVKNYKNYLKKLLTQLFDKYELNDLKGFQDFMKES